MSAADILKPGRFHRLFASDAVSVAREPVLLVNLFIGLLLPTLLYFFQEQLNQYAEATFGITAFAGYLVPFALIIPVILVGWVSGMLLLEDRDDGPLLALEVTAVGKGGFILYRTLVCFMIGLVAASYALWLLRPEFSALTVFVITMTALEAPLVSFLLIALAGNKVEGLALSKVINLLASVPFLSLLGTPLKYAAGLLPSFWLGEILYAPAGADQTISVIFALVTHALGLILCYGIAVRRLG